jgi:Tfp pilus assembly protein PilO
MKTRCNGVVVLALLGAAAVAYVVLVLAPNHRAIVKQRELIATKRAQAMQGGSIALAAEATRKDLARAKACIAAWDAKAPAEKDRATLFGRINELAKQAGVVSTRFEPEPPKRWERLVEIPLTIGVQGSFGQIQTFLYALEQLPTSIWVASAKLATDKDGRTVRGELTAVIFAANSDISDYVKVAGQPIN